MHFELIVSLRVSRTAFEIPNWFDNDNSILALVEKGSFVFDDGSGNTIAEPLDAVNFARGVRYSRHVIEPVILHLFRYKSDVAVFGEKSKIVFDDKERILSTLRLLNKLNSNIYVNDFQFKKSIFSDIITLYNIESLNQPEITTGDGFVDEVLNELQHHFHNKISLADLANSHNFSYVQFSRRFRQAVGVTPQDYVSGLRMTKAKHFLGTTDLPIKDIAISCGFSNEYYFSTFFKRYNTISPSVFRKNAKRMV